MKKTVYEVTFVERKNASAYVEREIVIATDTKSIAEHYEPMYEVMELKVIKTNTQVKVLP